MSYNSQKIEKKWQRVWKKTGIYQADLRRAKKPYYNLMMFPYPSAEGLHVGNVYAFTGSDIRGRFRRMQGYNVFEPIGFDAFGIHSENFAIKKGIHPKILIKRNIAHFRQQLKNLGCIFDWKRVVDTTNPNYYKWTQWLFLQLFKAGLAYRKKAPVDWCPSCKTVLADEQVIQGKCERCDSEVIQKDTEQWFLKITDYAEKLLKNLDWIDWSEKTKFTQKNWIGKSEGTEIKFPITELLRSKSEGEKEGEVLFDSDSQLPSVIAKVEKKESSSTSIDVFTTRPDTLFGCTYLVLAPEHPIINNLKYQTELPAGSEGEEENKFSSPISNLKFVEKYIEDSKKKTERERVSEVKEKTGVELKGIRAINPANNREISVWVADYVLYHYGTGAIMAVPAHDQRDLDFAEKYNLPVIEVIRSYFQKKELLRRTPLVVSDGRLKKAYEGEGYLLNSGRFDGMKSETARDRITEWLSKKERAKRAVYYKLRDWLISRQRYWGTPIPMVFCKICGWQPVKEKDLPVLLPEIRDFQPTKEGKSPLAKVKSFVDIPCPKCGDPAERETDTMDTFVCSSWYYLRYSDPKNDKVFASEQKLKTWLPVTIYIGGAEHAVLHLLYSRFFTKVLKELDFVDFKEPFLRLCHQGIILGPDGQKMSKSRGNVVDPDTQVAKYGSDAVRMYLCFMGPYNQGGPWNPKGIEGIVRFLTRVWNLFDGLKDKEEETQTKNEKLERLVNKTIKKVEEDIENLKFNTAISALMILVNQLTLNSEKKSQISNGAGNKQLAKNYLKTLLLLLAPFAPHLSEELWQNFIIRGSKFEIKNSIHGQSWPKYDQKLIKEKIISLIVQVNGRVRDKIEVEFDISEEKAKILALSRDKVQKWITGKEIKKVVFVKEKLINIVV